MCRACRALRNTTSFPPLLHHQDGNFIPRSNGKWGAIIHYKPQPPQGSHDTSVGRGPVSVASRAKLRKIENALSVPFCRPTGPSDHTTVTRTTIQALATVSHAARCVRARERVERSDVVRLRVVSTCATHIKPVSDAGSCRCADVAVQSPIGGERQNAMATLFTHALHCPQGSRARLAPQGPTASCPAVAAYRSRPA